jgi:hypothetical protein
MVLDCDLDCKAQLAFGDFGSFVLAFLVYAASACV